MWVLEHLSEEIMSKDNLIYPSLDRRFKILRENPWIDNYSLTLHYHTWKLSCLPGNRLTTTPRESRISTKMSFKPATSSVRCRKLSVLKSTNFNTDRHGAWFSNRLFQSLFTAKWYQSNTWMIISQGCHLSKRATNIHIWPELGDLMRRGQKKIIYPALSHNHQVSWVQKQIEDAWIKLKSYLTTWSQGSKKIFLLRQANSTTRVETPLIATKKATMIRMVHSLEYKAIASLVIQSVFQKLAALLLTQKVGLFLY